ncbi:MAG: hypothetical protein JO340_14565 [Acidobacteriaceae bacterium]|nr:hypothetical protein [Acidobacteriaceae bacterium]
MKSRRAVRDPSPFQTLVAHFVRRIFASEDEQGTGSSGVGVGAVLAMLASPGAFASIFLLDKYSTLLQWFRGETNFNLYTASVGDEYFFVVLSMTITGLVMVLRWNRLLPDRRDFANLAILPIPIRDVFLANFTGLLGLALVFAIDVNAVSSFLFPAFVTMSDGSVSAFAHLAIAHLSAVISASIFSFFAVFALVGVLMLVLPARLFRPVSLAVRMLLVIALLGEFLSNLFLQLFSGRVPNLRDAYTRWLPSYWFLAIYEKVLGLANARMHSLAQEALAALAAAIVIAVLAYALCYRRHFLRLSESLDLVGPATRAMRIALPDSIAAHLFRSRFEHGCHSFVCKVLLRSERHMMFLGGYLGIGLLLAAQTAADSSIGRAGPRALPTSDWLALPFILSFFVITGLRFAFDMPAALAANWMFRGAIGGMRETPESMARRFMLWAVLPWELAIIGAVTAARFGWVVAFEHTATLVVASVLLIHAVLIGFRKIPFTCLMEFDTRQLLIRILCCILGLLIAVPLFASLELWMMRQPWRFCVLALLAAAAWFALKRRNQQMFLAGDAIVFEQPPAAAFELLKLT